MNSVTFKILFFVKRTKPLKDGSLPIFVRITINGERSEFSLQMSVPEQLWDNQKGRAKGNAKQSRQLNQYIETVLTNLHIKKREMEETGELLTADNLRRSYLGLNEEKYQLLSLYRKHNQDCEKLIGIDFSLGTVVKYRSSYQHLEQYIKNNLRKKDIHFSEVNPMFLKGFETYLKIEKSCNHNTATKYLANLKKIYRIAYANGWAKNNPFAAYPLKMNEVDVDYLDENELQQLMERRFTIARIEQVKDVYLFCCFTGMAFVDVHSLTEKDIVSIGDQLWIKKKRQKTKSWFHVPLLPPALKIIKKYERHPECINKGVLLPVPSNQKMNAYLKEIADLMGIEKHLSTHTARHTFATTVTLSNQVSMEVVSKMLGHSNVNMTKRYARIVDDLISKDMAKVKTKFEIRLQKAT
jgi:site-specific recombinase XerD